MDMILHHALLLALLALSATAIAGFLILFFTQPQAAAVLARWLWRGMVVTLKALVYTVVGLAAAVLNALPWIIRAGGPVLYVWLALQAWPVLAGLYGATLPYLRYALLAVVLMATLLPVVYMGAKRPDWLWGAFYASAALLWLVWKRLPMIWPRYGLLFLLFLPGTYIILTALLIARLKFRRALRKLSITGKEAHYVSGHHAGTRP